MDMDTIKGILIIILAIPLWILYHKIFTVYYTDLFRGLLKEVVGALFTSFLIVEFLFNLLGRFFAFFIPAVLGILKVVIPILVVLVVISVIVAAIGKKGSK